MPEAADHVVVVGAGLAGARTAQELRQQGFAGDITLVGAELDPPYDRPPLSKGPLRELPDLGIDLAELRVNVLLGRTATAISGISPAGDEPLRIRIEVSNEAQENAAQESAESFAPPSESPVTELSAGAVVIATGAQPVYPDGWLEVPGVRVLRSWRDAVALWQELDDLGSGARVVIAGGSWIGMELASAAHRLGTEVRVVEKAAWLLPLMPPEVGRQVSVWCREAGIATSVGDTVLSVAPGHAVRGDKRVEGRSQVAVSTSAGDYVADLVVVALGVTPSTSWLGNSGLRTSPRGQALRVDAHLATLDDRVFAVGDVVERWSPRYGAWLPGGHWQDAMAEPQVAAANVRAALAGERQREVYDAVPYLWSEILGRTLQWSGYLADYRAARMLVRGDLGGANWTVVWLDDDDRMLAVLACDRPRDAVAARKAQAAHPAGMPLADVRVLADPDQPLQAALIRN